MTPMKIKNSGFVTAISLITTGVVFQLGFGEIGFAMSIVSIGLIGHLITR